MKVERLERTFFAKVTGVDLTRPLDEATYDAIWHLGIVDSRFRLIKFSGWF